MYILKSKNLFIIHFIKYARLQNFADPNFPALEQILQLCPSTRISYQRKPNPRSCKSCRLIAWKSKCLAKLKNKLVWLPTFAESVRMALDNLWIVERVKNNPLYKKCSVNLNQILVMEVFQIVCFEIFLQQNINKNPSCGAANCVKYARIWVFLCPTYSSLTIESKILSLNGNVRVIHPFLPSFIHS